MLPAAIAVGFDGLVGLGNCMYIFIYVHKHIIFCGAGMGQSILAGISAKLIASYRAKLEVGEVHVTHLWQPSFSIPNQRKMCIFLWFGTKGPAELGELRSWA
jgi:hypothetical protein